MKENNAKSIHLSTLNSDIISKQESDIPGLPWPK